jgi:nucleoside-diphosphate-sugar epimerase
MGREVRVVVTGASGKAGRAVVSDLRERGHEVLGVDLTPPSTVIDVCEFGEVVKCFAGADGVVHLAAIPAPGLQSEEVTFRTNITSTFNVFEAARLLGLSRVVWASSEAVFGVSFDEEPPVATPLSEESPSRTQSSYALSKVLGEELGREYWRRDRLPSVALRFSNIMEEHDYAEFPKWWGDPRARSWNLWGYVDVRDVAQSCRLGLTADISGAEAYGITAAETVMNRPSDELMAEVFPAVPHTAVPGSTTLVDIAKARRLLGYEPAHSWRDHV